MIKGLVARQRFVKSLRRIYRKRIAQGQRPMCQTRCNSNRPTALITGAVSGFLAHHAQRCSLVFRANPKTIKIVGLFASSCFWCSLTLAWCWTSEYPVVVHCAQLCLARGSLKRSPTDLRGSELLQTPLVSAGRGDCSLQCQSIF